MTASIQFDDQPGGGTKEIDDVRPHWVLASELKAF